MYKTKILERKKVKPYDEDRMKFLNIKKSKQVFFFKAHEPVKKYQIVKKYLKQNKLVEPIPIRDLQEDFQSHLVKCKLNVLKSTLLFGSLLYQGNLRTYKTIFKDGSFIYLVKPTI